MLNIKKNNLLKDKNKKAQVGETLSWILATIVIVFVLITFIYISSAMGKAKSIVPKELKVKIDGSEEYINWIGLKTKFAQNIENKNLDVINNWILKEDIENEK